MVAAWNWFWFSPADPVPLGIIRVCAGLVFLYVHLAYTGDLQDLVGPHSWIDLKTVNLFRHEHPLLARPLNSFAEPTPRFPLPPELQQKLREYNAQNMDDIHRLQAQGLIQLTPEQEQALAYYEKWGCDPNQPEVVAKGFRYFSIWLYVTDPQAMLAVHVTFLVILFLFTIGFCTRITSVLTWIGMVSYIQRTPNSVFGVDTMMNLVALYLMIGPSGAALSVDRLLVRYLGTWRALRGRRRVPDLKPAPMVSANLALRLLQINLCFIYMAAGLSKLLGNAWWSGSATWYTMANPEFSPLRFRWYSDYLQFLAEHAWLWYVSMGASVLLTLFFEISFSYMVWQRRTRWLMLGLAVVFHAGIALFMGLVTFSLMMSCFLIAFIPPEVLHRFLRQLGRGVGRLRLLFNSRERRQVRAAALVHAFDVWQQVELVESARPAGRRAGNGPAEGGRLEAIADDGTVLTGYPLFERVVRSLRLLWPAALLTYVPGVAALAGRRFPGMCQAAPAEDPAADDDEPTAATAGHLRSKI
jgi:hypothetical protein